jgi:hypothetical protein
MLVLPVAWVRHVGHLIGIGVVPGGDSQYQQRIGGDEDEDPHGQQR